MPGRFTLTATPDLVRETFPWLSVPDDLRPRYNAAPSQSLAVVLNDGSNKVDFLQWGLIPSFSTGGKLTNSLINARGDKITRTPAFRDPFKRKRCIILADGYYEWVKYAGKREKVPYRIQLKSGKPFAFAGVWDSWTSMDGSEVRTFASITTEPNELVVKIHHRMGVILHDKDTQTWLQPEEVDSKELLPLLVPYPAEEMKFYQVSSVVSNARNDVPECIAEVEENPIVPR